MRELLLVYVSTFVLCGCLTRTRKLEELDLTVLENSRHLSKDSLLKELTGKYLEKEDHSIGNYLNLDFYPVFVCGIPCSLAMTGATDSATFNSYFIECHYPDFEKLTDSIEQMGNEYSKIDRSAFALQDTLLARIRRKYGDWDSTVKEDGHYVPPRGSRLRSAEAIVRQGRDVFRRGVRFPPGLNSDTSTLLTLYDSSYFVKHFNRQW